MMKNNRETINTNSKNANMNKARLVCWPFCYSVPKINENKGTQINFDKNVNSNLNSVSNPYGNYNYKSNFILDNKRHNSNIHYDYDYDENDGQLTPTHFLENNDKDTEVSFKNYDKDMNLNRYYKLSSNTPALPMSPYQEYVNTAHDALEEAKK